jgi:hypothetical protein
MPIELQPVLSGVRAAYLDLYPDNGPPYALTIELAPGARVTAAALQQAFGDYEQVHTHLGQPPEIIFYPPAVGSRWRVAVIATLESAEVSLDHQPVTSLSLRRDSVAP